MTMLAERPARPLLRGAPVHEVEEAAPGMASVAAVARATVGVSASQVLLGAAAVGHVAGATVNRAMDELRTDGAAVARLAAPARMLTRG
jgi:hypothetical protein